MPQTIIADGEEVFVLARTPLEDIFTLLAELADCARNLHEIAEIALPGDDAHYLALEDRATAMRNHIRTLLDYKERT